MDLNKTTMKLVIVWGIFFSLTALFTAMIAGLNNVKWVQLDAQSKLLLILVVFVNWSGTMMAFLSKTVARLEKNEPILPNGNTDFFVKQTEEQTNTVAATEKEPAKSIVVTQQTVTSKQTVPVETVPIVNKPTTD